MSIIGGFFYFETVPEPHNIRDCLNHFHCLSSESKDEDQIEIIQYAHGYLFSKGKHNIRSLITSRQDSLGNALVMLGYSNLDDWKAWNVTEGRLGLPNVFPPSFPDKLIDMEGEYTALYFEMQTDKLHIINDRFGSRPLFYIKTDKGVFFCSNIILLLRLCRHCVNLNPAGLMQMFRFGHTVGQTTHIVGVERVLAASHLAVSTKNIDQRKYWNLDYDPQHHLDPAAFSSQVYATFREAAARRAQLMNRGLLALSGGLDSRLIAASLPDDVDFSFYTFFSSLGSPSRDVDVAKQIAAILHRRHLTKALLPGIFSASAKDLTMLVGGLVSMNNSFKSLPPAELGYDLYMAGGPGDNLIGSYVPSIHAALESQTPFFINQYTHITNPSTFMYFMSSEMFNSHLQEYQTLMEHSFEGIRSPTAAHKICAWCMTYRQPGFTFTNAHHCHPYMSQIRPHLGYAYNDLILKLPALWLYQKQFYKYMIYHALPLLQSIIYANTNHPLSGKLGPSSRPEWFFKLYSLRRRILAGWKTLTARSAAKTKSFELALIQQDPEFTRTIEDILLSYPDLKSYFNTDQCIRYIRQVKTNTPPEVRVGRIEEPIGYLGAITYLYQIMNSL